MLTLIAIMIVVASAAAAVQVVVPTLADRRRPRRSVRARIARLITRGGADHEQHSVG